MRVGVQRATALCRSARCPRFIPPSPLQAAKREFATALVMRQGFSNVFFLFPSPPQKRVKERVAGWALPRPTGNTLLLNLGRGACCQAKRRLRNPGEMT